MDINRYIYIPRATIAIIIFNIICFIYEISQCKASRHISFDHIHSNMAALLLFGGYVESKVGWKRFTVCYLLSGLGGHILWNIMDGRPSAGSSSAVWGRRGRRGRRGQPPYYFTFLGLPPFFGLKALCSSFSSFSVNSKLPRGLPVEVAFLISSSLHSSFMNL